MVVLRPPLLLSSRSTGSGLVGKGAGNDGERAMVNVFCWAGVVVLEIDTVLGDVLVLTVVPNGSGGLLDWTSTVLGVVEVTLVTVHLQERSVTLNPSSPF